MGFGVDGEGLAFTRSLAVARSGEFAKEMGELASGKLNRCTLVWCNWL